ncbi:DJ-1/PfpI family protein [Catellatospora citrea]|uniref:DJ-1/PfpI family protein n=1 Tax=Catellatospora citrea TaxID=53366 RepID=UPI00194529FF|nr:DJ-1/PfpI family protein [Catellatospora citrea]
MTIVAVLLYPGFTGLDAVGPYEVLARVPDTRVVFVGRQAGPVVADTGALTVLAEQAMDDLTAPDVLVIPGGLEGSFTAAADEGYVDWVRTAHVTSTWTASVCTGALMLGAAGILRGQSATTHWAAKDYLARYGATYVPERVVEHDRVITAAGVSAGIDMGLRLAAHLAGPAVAEAIQLAIEYDPQPPYAAGSLRTASPETVQLAVDLMRAETLP